MRAFFGLSVEEASGAVASWRASALPPFERPVAAENLHITLVFLGDINTRQFRQLSQLAGLVAGRAFPLQLNSIGYWPKQEVSFLAPRQVPQPLDNLVSDLRRLAKRAQLRVEKRQYQPHLTLARRCLRAPPAPLTEPDFHLHCSDFTLFESVAQRNGVRYEQIQSWPLA